MHDVGTYDVPNAFIQTDMPKRKIGERIIMKVTGALVDMLVEIDSELYAEKVVYEGNKKVLYLEVLKPIYGMLQSALLYYKKFKADIETIGFEVNPYDPCVANRMVNGKQHTITWHVDDVKSSHKDPKVNDEFHKWLNDMYGDPKIGEVKAHRGKVHEYLGMTLDYRTPGKVKIDMTSYVKSMIKEFPEDLGDETVSSPANDNLFKVSEKSKKLSKEKAEQFHTFIAKGLFASR